MINKEDIIQYIEQRTQAIAEFNAKLKAQDDSFCKDLLTDFPIKKGTIIKRTHSIGSFFRPSSKIDFYKVIDYDATPDGIVTLICNKRKINGEYGSRVVKLLSVSYYNDFAIPDNTIDDYEIVNE